MNALLSKLFQSLIDHGIALPFQRTLAQRMKLTDVQIHRIEKLVDAQGDFEAEQIRSGQKCFTDFPMQLARLPTIVQQASQEHFHRIEPTLGDSSLVRDVCTEFTLDQVRRSQNLSRTLQITHDLLEKDDSAAEDSSIESDWLYGWRDAAREVTNQQLRRLLARMLAEEIKYPHRYSIRTLNFLRMATTKELKTMQWLARFIISDKYFWLNTIEPPPSPNDLSLLVVASPTLPSMSTFSKLHELGVISFASDPLLSVYWHRNPAPEVTLDYFGRRFRVSGAGGEHKYGPPLQCLNEVGRELYQLFQAEMRLEPVPGYIEQMTEHFQSQASLRVEEIS